MRGKTALEVMGLLSSLFLLQPDDLIVSNLARMDVTTARPYEIGIRLMAVGNTLAKRSWDEAIPWFRAAEKMFGSSSNQGARAALNVAQTLLYLGDYSGVQNEIFRVEQVYGAVLDPEAKTELYRIKGWLEYYVGNFPRSVKWLEKNVSLSEEIGINTLGDRHFLGRVYSDWGQTTIRQDEAGPLYHQAEMQLYKSYQLRRKVGTDWDLERIPL